MNVIESPPAVAEGPSAALLARYRIGPGDLAHVRSHGEHVIPRLDAYAERFHAWLATRPELDAAFSDAGVRSRQVAHWRDFFSAIVDDGYVERCRALGAMHGERGLPLPDYFAAASASLGILTEDLADPDRPAEERAAIACAVSKLLQLDTALVVESYQRASERAIREQHEALLQTSTPVTAVWDGVLMVPVVGIVDSRRAQDMMHAMLTAIHETRSQVIIMDISGVAVVDTAVANHLIKITRATRLMGCECTISGVSPAIARTVVELGIDIGSVRTTATLKDALAAALEAIGARPGDAGDRTSVLGPA